jgi:anti-sigma regulatory factor (Ser/Thr protein kinase)
MKELSLHILDLVQNSIHANASLIRISIDESTIEDTYSIEISDNGSGMNEQTIKKVLDPFFTTKNKKTGLGIPLLKQHAELTDGKFNIETELDKGTKVTAVFGHSHFDRQPLGDITGTITGLIRSYPEIDFEYKHKVNTSKFTFGTRDIREELEGISLASPEIINFIKEMLTENIRELYK